MGYFCEKLNVMTKYFLILTVLLFINKYNPSQSIGTYVFTNGTTTVEYPGTTTYYPVNGGGGSLDNGKSLPQTIPFTFNFGGTDFTQYEMCSNGFLSFGTGLSSSEYGPFYQPLTGTRNNVLCYTARDLAPDAFTFFGYSNEGTAPNRVHKIVCLGLRYVGGSSRGNCQIYLYEGTNKIEIIYNAYPTNWVSFCRVGLRGGSANSSDLKTLLGTDANAWINPVAGNTNNAYMNQQSPVNVDEGRIYTFYYDPTPMYYVSSNVTQTITSNVYSGATNQQLVGIEVVMGGYINILNLTGLTLNTSGSTNAAGDILNAKVYYTGPTGIFSTSSLFGTVYNSPNGSYAINGSQALVNGTNYFWLVYNISPGAAAGNVVDAECNQITLSGTGGTQIPPIQAPPGSRQIIPALTSINVGTGETFTSLTNSGGLFEAINTGAFPVAANINVNITSNLTETGTFNLNDWQNTYSINIVPSAAVERLISGSNSTTALLTLSGADNVNIDGRFSGSGKYLRFRNTNSTKPTIQFMNDSKRNTIRDCYIESNNTQTSLGLGAILFSTTTGTTGNDSNTIMNCDIRNRSDAAGNPVYGIVCSGNTAITNDNNTVSGCNIYNFNASSNTYGIYLLTGTGPNWLIENNSFFNTSPIASTLWYAIYINNMNSGGHSVLNNYIGGTTANCGGTALSGTLRTLNGIYLRAISTSSNTVSGNVIRNINITKTSNAALEDGLIGIYTSRSSYTITNNVMGDTATNDNIRVTGSTGITMFGAFIQADSSNTLSISGNTISSVSIAVGSGCRFTAISSGESYFNNYQSSNTKQVTNNKIGSFTTANSIKITTSAGSSLYGILAVYSGSPQINITGNRICNLSNMLPGSSSDDAYGIYGAAGYSNQDMVCNLSDNIIFSLTSSYSWGISFTTEDILQFTGGTAIGSFNVINNTVNGMYAPGGGIVNTLAGIYLFAKADYNNISGNKVCNLSNSQDGGSILGLAVRSNYFFSMGRYPYEKNLIYNNQVSLTNGELSDKKTSGYRGDSYTNSQYIIGIDVDHGDSNRVLNNTVYIGGTDGANRKSECLRFEFYYGSNTNPDIRNNLLVNNRTGSGDHIAVTVERPDTNFIAGTFNYNTYITASTDKIGHWYEGYNKSFDLWKDSSKSDKQSWAASTTEINPANLFVDAAGGNLNINYNNPEAWIVSGKGIPLSYVSADYEGNPRSTSVMYNYPTDIGSDEFTQTPPDNPAATETGTPGSGNTTTYKLYGRTVMQINWGTGGTSYPSDMNVKYFSGVQPPEITGGYGSSYWQVTPNGILSGAVYDITINFGDNETNSIMTPSINTRLAKRNTDWVAYTTPGTGNLETELNWVNLWAKVRGLENFSEFALIDYSNALPVELCSFSASTNNRNVTLVWQTCSELNNAGFDIERRKEDPVSKIFSAWQKTAFIEGYGNSTEIKNYNYVEKKLDAGRYQYRLKQIDYNGNAEYYQLSNPEVIEIGKPGTIEMSQNYPNPSNPKTKIDYQIPFNGKVSLLIYDVLGREVIKLVNNELKETGYYTAEFDGSSLASGVYFYRFIADGEGQKFSKTMKLILVK
jgi:hypothetical protein